VARKIHQVAIRDILCFAGLADELLDVEIKAGFSEQVVLNLGDCRFEFGLFVEVSRVELLYCCPEHKV
jgi:hypothetical protein